MWIERGTGQVGAASDGSGRLAWFATVEHFSAWNCDLPVEEKSCVSGRVISEGAPIVGAEVVAIGVDYNGVNGARTDTDGMFCIEVKRGSTVRLEVRLNGAAAPVATREITAPNTAESCTSGICEDTGDIEVELDSCVRGRVLGDDGGPMPLEYVYIAPGITAVTNADGYYCARAPANTTVYVFAENRPAVSAVTPSSGTCAGGGCAGIDLTITLATAGDTVGTLEVSKDVAYAGMSGIFGAEDPFTSFNISGTFLTFDPSQFTDVSFSGITVDEEVFGECTVRTVTIDISALSEEDTATGSFLAGVGALDPGNPGRASNGVVAVDLLPGDPFTDFDDPIPAAAGFYEPAEADADLLALGFDAGQTITFNFPGGADIGMFDASIAVPADLNLTTPDLANPDLALDFTSALDLVWMAGSASETVFVSVYVNDAVAFDVGEEGPSGPITSTFVECEFADTGSGTIPAAAMSRLPAESDFSNFSAMRQREFDVGAPLNRVDGDGIVRVVARAGVSRSFFDLDIPDIPDIDDLLPTTSIRTISRTICYRMILIRMKSTMESRTTSIRMTSTPAHCWASPARRARSATSTRSRLRACRRSNVV